MANTNNNRKRKKSKYGKKSPNPKFNKKSFSIFCMFISLLGFIFLILPNTGSLGDFITYTNFKIFGFMSYFVFAFIFTSFLFAFRDKFKENLRVFNIIFILIILTMAILSLKYLGKNLNISIKNTQTSLKKSGGFLGTYIGFYLESFIGSAGIIIFYILMWIALVKNMLGLSYKDFLSKIKEKSQIIGNILWKSYMKISNKIKTYFKEKNLKNKK
ncbi:hypothetical protein ANHYDRO_01072 [Anaerococcus hydrogenalis DSM 7454]|uniref:DNA translocase FtsK 4TM region domain-containing protein n=1 Tax=Anaerococcus hydrogenalis DSM 7454 TaxID=561177 RepID=B6W921_9FIRM|nr:DNA translocase FtsK 4TM domain-containing protein [Anaerococcus hydrogenalis]EEB36077.1 hypothetical protein ANHYDRO_01072 [Anaerococcus hydrogenalis DSM 7454]